ncbi:uncharacterized protein LOC117106295 [Anneissia japonica]|uniref:uncharacterized protein LOC117106295 n=1 Tax=Anneissia japonica TaxID=1529436 RepID=UPI001425A541|nr:uncharacterized protein LOC117106295 [Anneissia japonica]
MAYQIAEESGKPHHFSSKTKKAGYDWLKGFQKRNAHLSIRKPEALSAQRAKSMNEVAVGRYFKLLGDILDKLNIKDKVAPIWNCDESGLSSVHRPPKILATKGKKQVHSKTSGERGINTIVLACANAAGTFIPPFIIYKGARLQASLTRFAPPGTLFGCSPTSFINGELFHLWMEFFLRNIPPTCPVLLLLDGHASHVTVETIQLAKDNGVEMLHFPPHTTHWLQPLDRSFFGPLKTAYNEECTAFMARNPSKVVTQHDFSELFAPTNSDGNDVAVASTLPTANDPSVASTSATASNATVTPTPATPSTSSASSVSDDRLSKLLTVPTVTPNLNPNKKRQSTKSRVLTEDEFL